MIFVAGVFRDSMIEKSIPVIPQLSRTLLLFSEFIPYIVVRTLTLQIKEWQEEAKYMTTAGVEPAIS